MNLHNGQSAELKDIRDVNIDMSMPLEKRRESYLEQIINPYCFKYKNIVVNVEFNGQESLEDKLVSHFIKK